MRWLALLGGVLIQLVIGGVYAWSLFGRALQQPDTMGLGHVAATVPFEAAIGMINTKTTAVRVIPAPGCKVGDTVEFGRLLGSAPVQAVHPYSSAEFIARGGRIPAPLHSLKN